MKKSLKKSNAKKGFTIIEVVLVLAIAGLIFLMVFIALPALQRSQRDTQRKDDVARLQTALNSYQSNNRGALPTPNSGASSFPLHLLGDTVVDNMNCGTITAWSCFYGRYLLVGAAGAVDTFEDPDGTPYSLGIYLCGTAANQACDNTQQAPRSWDDQVNPGTGNSHAIKVVLSAVCQGEIAIRSSGARKVAMLYKLEGGGVVCVNN